MILPIILKQNIHNKVNGFNDNHSKNKQNIQNYKQLELSGFNNPMKSYISFGWCTAHYQAMYEIDEKFTQKINEKLKEIENLKNKKKERYSIVDNASVQAAKILAQYANMQCVIAEVPPAYAVMNGGKLKQAMEESETFTNPVSSLIAINALVHMDVKNETLDERHLEKGKGATQLYAITILLKQIKENTNKPEFDKNRDKINELTLIVKKSLCEIYGDNIFERIEKFGNMGKKPTDEEKSQALDFLVEVDSEARSLELHKDFQEKLQILLDAQNADEERTLQATDSIMNGFVVKIQYPDHEHSVAHAHGIPHSHEHHKEHNSQYQTILENMHSQKTAQKQQITEEQEKKKIIKGE